MEIVKESNIDDNIYEVIVGLAISKKTDEKVAIIAELLSDIRAITRVTIVNSLRSYSTGRTQNIDVKIKFNTKRLGQYTPESFVRKVILPAVRKLDANPNIKFISKVKDYISI